MPTDRHRKGAVWLIVCMATALMAVVVVLLVASGRTTSTTTTSPTPAGTPLPASGSSVAPDSEATTPLPTPSVAGMWVGSMDHGAYAYRMRLHEQDDGSVTGWIAQTDTSDPSLVGKELLAGEWQDDTLLLNGIGWAYRPDGWRDDTLRLTLNAGGTRLHGSYDWDGCSGNPYTITGHQY